MSLQHLGCHGDFKQGSNREVAHLFATFFFIVRFFTILKSLTSVLVSGLRFIPVYKGCVALFPLLAPNLFMTRARKSLPGELDPPFADL